MFNCVMVTGHILRDASLEVRELLLPLCFRTFLGLGPLQLLQLLPFFVKKGVCVGRIAAAAAETVLVAPFAATFPS